MWDADADVDALVREYCQQFYGAAADSVEQYIWTLEDAVEATTTHERWGELMQWSLILPPIADKLNADMRARGLTWPDHIANPGAFLHSRLRRLPWTPPEPARKAGGSAAASIDQTPAPVVLTDASRARIAAAKEEIRRVLAERAQRTCLDHP